MKKAIVGLMTVGAVIGLRSLARRMGPKMREHCEPMAAHFAHHAEAVSRT